jgi:serine/threonine-protein kinase
MDLFSTDLSPSKGADPEGGDRATKPATPIAVADAAGIGSDSTIPPPPPDDEGTDARITPGTTVADRYRIARVLGEGGMGIVYAAEHVLMRKEVALKVLHPDMLADAEIVARFEREAIAAGSIDHPNVASATDFGRLPNGAFYLVLELLKGASLRSELSRNGALPLARALRVLRGIASGVAAAHQKGIIHRDLKPENVMLVEREGEADFVKVLDFGVAKVDASVADAPHGGAVLTRAGSVFGTPEYMAPEQAAGDVVDARADLYALGIVLLEMLTGACPFEGNPMEILRARLFMTEPLDLSGVEDAGARALVGRLLERDVQARMQTATELVTALDELLGNAGAVSVRTSDPALLPTSLAAASVLTAPGVRIRTVPPKTTSLDRRWVGAVALAAALVGGIGFVLVARPSHGSDVSTKLSASASASASDALPTSTSLPLPPPAPEASAEPADSAEPAKGRAPAKPKKRPKKGGGINIPNIPFL